MHACSLQNGGRLQASVMTPFLKVQDERRGEVGMVHGHMECRINAARTSAFMLLTTAAFGRQFGDCLERQSNVTDTPEQIRAWMLATIERTGWSPRRWATEADVAASTVQRAIKPDYPFVTSSRTLAKLAKAAGENPPEIGGHLQMQSTPAQFLDVRYEVGAGIWRSVEDLAQSYGSAPVMEDPSLKGIPQWLERVTSDSMDLEYPAGTLLHVVDAEAIHYSVRNGDHVIIERRRNGGGLVERTVKEAVVTPNGVEFWGRSTNARWNRPFTLDDTNENNETLQVEIAALVIGSYRSRRS